MLRYVSCSSVVGPSVSEDPRRRRLPSATRCNSAYNMPNSASAAAGSDRSARSMSAWISVSTCSSACDMVSDSAERPGRASKLNGDTAKARGGVLLRGGVRARIARHAHAKSSIGCRVDVDDSAKCVIEAQELFESAQPGARRCVHSLRTCAGAIIAHFEQHSADHPTTGHSHGAARGAWRDAVPDRILDQ